MTEGFIFEYRATVGFERLPDTQVADCDSCGRRYIRNDREEFGTCECGGRLYRLRIIAQKRDIWDNVPRGTIPENEKVQKHE